MSKSIYRQLLLLGLTPAQINGIFQSAANVQSALVTTLAAKDAALIQAGVYTTEAEGRSAVADGVAFKVQGSGDIAAYEYRRTNSSSSTLIATYPAYAGTLSQTNISDVLSGELPINRNIFSSGSATDNYAIRATDGAAVSAAGYFSTDYIKVKSGGQFIANKDIFANGATYGLAFYNIKRTFIAGSGIFTVQNAGTPVTVPEGAAYVRFCVQGLSKKGNLMVVHGASLPANFGAHDFIDEYTLRTQIAMAITETLQPVQNLFRPETIAADTVVNSTTGATSSAANFFASDYIRVTPGTITCDTTSTLSATYGWAFYDASKAFISGIAGPVTANVAVTVPQGAAYCRLSMHNGAANPKPRYNMMVWQGATAPTAYKAPGYADEALSFRRAQDAVKGYLSISNGWNLFVKSRVTTGQALLITGVISVGGAYANYCTTDYMPVRPGVPFSANAGLSFGVSLGWVYYDKDFNYISGVAGGTYTAGEGITPPASAAYMRTTWLSNQISRLKINEGTTTPADILGIEAIRALYPYAGKKLSTGGDSIMATADGSNVYFLELVSRLKCTAGINAATSGYRMYQIWTTHSASEFADTDLFIMHAGTNDFYVPSGSPTPIGSISDAAASGSGASFIAATKYLIETLLGVNNKIRIIFLAPMQRFGGGAYGPGGMVANSLGFVLADYTNALIATAKLYGCPVYDQAGNNGINAINQSIYLADTLHPNQAGYNERIIPAAVAFINAN